MKYILTLIFLFFQNLAFAQNIEVLELETARIYDPGVLDAVTDTMDANLWRGTSSLTAISLINKIPTKECLEKGTEMSSKIIQKVGARLD